MPNVLSKFLFIETFQNASDFRVLKGMTRRELRSVKRFVIVGEIEPNKWDVNNLLLPTIR